MGETESQNKYGTLSAYFGDNWQDYFRAYLLGGSYVAMRTEDILSCARLLINLVNSETDGVHLIAVSKATVPALHAAALEPSLFASVRLEKGIRSWAEVVRTPVTRQQLTNTVHGALRVYDLPDLVASLASSKISVVGSVTPTGQPVPVDR
jgi:hypothetical protein